MGNLAPVSSQKRVSPRPGRAHRAGGLHPPPTAQGCQHHTPTGSPTSSRLRPPTQLGKKVLCSVRGSGQEKGRQAAWRVLRIWDPSGLNPAQRKWSQTPSLPASCLLSTHNLKDSVLGSSLSQAPRNAVFMLSS